MAHRLPVAILGASGRMGRAVAAAIAERDDVQVVGASCSPDSQWLGRDLSEVVGGAHRAVAIASDVGTAIRDARVAIDFTLPAATAGNLEACVAAKCAVVIGATGQDEAGRRRIDAAAARIPILLAPNMSLGVNLLLKLVEMTARALDARYDIEVFEAHHRNKKDAPSGTALALGRAAADGREVKLEDAADYARYGETGARRPGSIGFSVFRGGDVVGDHTVTFAGPSERIELTHRASDRLVFARGAVQAALWIARREPGLYSMQDVLGLSER